MGIMSQSTHPGKPTPNDEDLFGAFDRLKANINEIKSANSSRNSVDRGMEPNANATITEPIVSRGRHSRQSSVTVDPQPHARQKSSRNSIHVTDGNGPDAKTIHNNGRNGGGIAESDTGKRNGTRSRQESYSSRADDSSRISTRSHLQDSSRTAKHRTSHRNNPTPSERSVHVDPENHDYNRELTREHSRISNGRDSRVSERSHRTSRSKGVDWSTEQFLSQYHREWMIHWQYQQQQQQQQQQSIQSQPRPPVPPAPGSQWGGAELSFQQQPSQVTSILPSPGSSANLSAMVMQNMVAPAPAGFQPIPRPPSVQSQPAMPPVGKIPVFAAPVLKAATGHQQRSALRPQRAEWKGCLLSASNSTEIVRIGRNTTVLVKSTAADADWPFRTEMELFPGMLLFDSQELRDRVVDFGRHMSDVVKATADIGAVEIESVFWDLVVHLVSRAENSRPYEVAEILTRLVQDTGRSSVASIRSVSGRDRYSDSALHDIRKRLLVGDIESAVKHAEDSGCWDLALCLQTASSNLECKNQQANDLAIKCLDQRLQRGDPVHTICHLACGRLPSVEACFRDWVSNLAIVIACAGFIPQEELRQRFISGLSDLLNSADMPVARDICLIFCDPSQRFNLALRFTPIGASVDSPGGHGTFLETFSLPNFFMTEVFVFLAQILQGINLHANVDLIKMQLRYIQMLLERGMTRPAAEYCRLTAIVVKEYRVPISVEVFSQLLEVTTLCVSANQVEFKEEWCQWLWNVCLQRNQSITDQPTNQSINQRPINQPINDQRHPVSVSDMESVRRKRSGSQDSFGFTPSTDTSFASHSYDSMQSRHHIHDVHESSSIHRPPLSAKPSSDVAGGASHNLASSSVYSGVNSRRNSYSTEDFAQYTAVSRRPSESLPSVIAVNGPHPSHSIPTDPIHSSLHQKLSPRNSVESNVQKTNLSPRNSVEENDEHQSMESSIAPPAPIMMYQAPAADAMRPNSLFMSPFSMAGPSNFLSQSVVADSFPAQPTTPGDLNTGNAPYFRNSGGDVQSDVPSESDDEPSSSQASELSKPKYHDPTAFDDDPPPATVRTSDKKTAAKDAENVRKNPGLFGTLRSFFKRKGQVHLPDDKVPTIVWDKETNSWRDTSKPAGEQVSAVAPPPKLHFPQPGASGTPVNGPAAPPAGNLFRLGAAPATGGYNPYAHLIPTSAPNANVSAQRPTFFMPSAMPITPIQEE